MLGLADCSWIACGMLGIGRLMAAYKGMLGLRFGCRFTFDDITVIGTYSLSSPGKICHFFLDFYWIGEYSG